MTRLARVLSSFEQVLTHVPTDNFIRTSLVISFTPQLVSLTVLKSQNFIL